MAKYFLALIVFAVITIIGAFVLAAVSDGRSPLVGPPAHRMHMGGNHLKAVQPPAEHGKPHTRSQGIARQP